MIYRHRKVQLFTFIIISGLYITIKYLISPFLFALRKAGLKSKLPGSVDARINRLVLPLTEVPHKLLKREVHVNFNPGDFPDVISILSSSLKSDFIQKITGIPLMIIFIRGSWCPYSRLHLSDLSSIRNLIEATGVRMLVVSSYNDFEWWNSREIDFPMVVDSEGRIFKKFGLLVNSWYEFTWGRIIPHESVFLFSDNGKLIESDVRNVSNLLPGQKFLSSKVWLKIIKNNQSVLQVGESS
jgi:peroxiredoxin